VNKTYTPSSLVMDLMRSSNLPSANIRVRSIDLFIVTAFDNGEGASLGEPALLAGGVTTETMISLGGDTACPNGEE
jgi:hypothetical protein